MDIIYMPEPEAAAEGSQVVAEPRTGRLFLDFFCVPTTEHDVVGEHCGLECWNSSRHGPAPPALTHPLESAATEDIAKRTATGFRDVAQFQWDNHILRDESRTEPGAKAEEEHPSAIVAAERLHRGVVDDSYRAIERGSEVKAHPTRAEVTRFLLRAVVACLAGVANRHRVVLPVARQIANDLDHALGSQPRA